MATSDWSDFLAVDWLTMEYISIFLPPDYILKKQKLLTLREAHVFTRCVTRSLVLCVCFVDRCLSFVLFLLAIVAKTNTSFNMSRKSKSKDQTKTLSIPVTLTDTILTEVGVS
jgi:hypothetical protein